MINVSEDLTALQVCGKRAGMSAMFLWCRHSALGGGWPWGLWRSAPSRILQSLPLGPLPQARGERDHHLNTVYLELALNDYVQRHGSVHRRCWRTFPQP
jgi:hypothetical protein